MIQEKRSPAPEAASRPSEALCLGGDRSQDALANALNPLLFDEIEHSADKAASIWRSIAEAAFRGDTMTVAVHLRQVRLVTFHVHELVKQFGSRSQEARAA